MVDRGYTYNIYIYIYIRFEWVGLSSYSRLGIPKYFNWAFELISSNNYPYIAYISIFYRLMGVSIEKSLLGLLEWR